MIFVLFAVLGVLLTVNEAVLGNVWAAFGRGAGVATAVFLVIGAGTRCEVADGLLAAVAEGRIWPLAARA